MTQKTGKSNARKRTSKQNKGKSQLVRGNYMKYPIPDTMHMEMVYTTGISVGAAAGLQCSYGFRLNSVFDPDFTGVGQQPNYYDQMSALYNEYRVVACKIQWTMCNQSSDPVRYCWFPSTANAPDASFTANCGQRRAKTGLIANTGSYLGTNTGSLGFKVSSLWGVPDMVVKAEDDFTGQITGNPNNALYWWFCGFPIGSNATNIKGELKLTYYVDWIMPKIVPGS